MFGPSADLISLVYAAMAAYTVWQLVRPGRWRALWDATYTDDDRNMANRMGLLLLTPVGVLTHELAHLVAAWWLGARATSLSFRVYWGYVQYRPSLGPTSDWVVAVAGPAASLALGLAALLVAARLRAAWRDIALAFAHATVLLVLLLYPALSFVDGVGDFRTIYSGATPTLSLLAAAVHALGLGLYLLVARQLAHQAKAEVRAAWSDRFAGQAVSLRPEQLDRLQILEAAESSGQLHSGEREELAGLREARAWVVEHNRRVQEAESTVQGSVE